MRRSSKFLTGLLACLFFVVSTGAQTNAAPAKRPLEIRGVGDSVIAGEGLNYDWSYNLATGSWTPANPDPYWNDVFNPKFFPSCHSSTLSYLALLRFSRVHTDHVVRGRPCTGAKATNGILRTQTLPDGTPTAWQPQVGSLKAGYDFPSTEFGSPDVVTLSLGADDIHFDEILTQCYMSFENYGFCDSDNSLRLRMQAELAVQRQNLDIVLTEIEQRQKQAGRKPFILVNTYYDPFGSTYRRCQDILPIAGVAGLSQGEVSFLRSLLFTLNDNIRAMALKHRSSVKVVDIQNAFQGHEFCTPDPWVLGPSIRIDYPDNPSPFHPTTAGQVVIADKVAAAINARFRL